MSYLSQYIRGISSAGVKCLAIVFTFVILLPMVLTLSGCQEDKVVQKPRKKYYNPPKKIALAFSHNSKLVIITETTTTRLWDITNGKLLTTQSPRNYARYVGFTPDGIPYNGSPEGVIFWDKETGKTIKELPTSKRYSKEGGWIGCNPIIITRDGSKEIVEISEDVKNPKRTYLVRDLKTDKKQFFTIDKYPYASLASCSADGRYLAVYSSDVEKKHPQIILWDTVKKSALAAIDVDPNSVTNSTFLSNDAELISVVEISGVSLYKPTPPPGEEPVKDEFASSKFSVCSLKTNEPNGQIVLDGIVDKVVFAPDKKTFMVLTEGKITLYNTQTLEEKMNLESKDHPIIDLAYSPDNKCIATGNGIGLLEIWDMKTGTLLSSLRERY